MLQPDERRLCDLLWWLALAHIAGGLVLPFVALATPLLDGVAAAAGLGKLGLALFGPTVASWGVLLAFLTHYGLRRRSRWACDALIAAVLVWMPLDFFLCLSQRLWAGVVVDALVLPLLLAPPLLLRRRYV
ncbi:MAG TPA: hypothetical protein VM074_05330 [Solimonas sp.]|nr:hypothetical protein [Solimonas sp.]